MISYRRKLSATAVILCWKYPQNVYRIVDALMEQTTIPTIFVWNNNPSCNFFHPQVSWCVNSSHNRRCGIAVPMMMLSETPYVIKIDDDLVPKDKYVIEDVLNFASMLEETMLVAATGVILNPDLPYQNGQHVNYPEKHTRVDVAKSMFCALRTNAIRQVPPQLWIHHADVAISGYLAAGEPLGHWVIGGMRERFEEIPKEFAACLENDHWTLRDQERRKWFKR